ncbi:hypothetical protein [Amycolatopsis sp. H20-H5]|uniref:hypothetical protein n=1 Tax=Amycolatopsis sp. H20-H5 TaxID=3046309 RepID=UPI002DB9D6EA|nr:hypothetical protein [Amycolatopsis sp. H20-H5]MEC3979064.1 hypothetical protein [Amycolatopsis sp. H20-H5]
MLRTRYRVTGVPADLDNAIGFCRYATTLRSADPAVLMSGLAISLRHRFACHRPGEENILFKIDAASAGSSGAMVQDVVYPPAGGVEVPLDLAKEFESKGRRTSSPSSGASRPSTPGTTGPG